MFRRVLYGIVALLLISMAPCWGGGESPKSATDTLKSGTGEEMKMYKCARIELDKEGIIEFVFFSERCSRYG